jgi:hypothetical protein
MTTLPPAESTTVAPERFALVATLGRAMLFSLVALQLMIALDAGLRWEHGFGFVRAVWARDVAIVVGTSAILFWLMVRRHLAAWRAAIIALPLFCILFGAASSGTVPFDWANAPLFSILQPSWAEPLALGGFRVGVTGTVVTALLCSIRRYSVRRNITLNQARRRALLGFGFAWLAAASLRFTDLLPEYPYSLLPEAYQPDDPVLLERLSLARTALWAPAVVVGASLLILGMRLRLNARAAVEDRP